MFYTLNEPKNDNKVFMSCFDWNIHFVTVDILFERYQLLCIEYAIEDGECLRGCVRGTHVSFWISLPLFPLMLSSSSSVSLVKNKRELWTKTNQQKQIKMTIMNMLIWRNLLFWLLSNTLIPGNVHNNFPREQNSLLPLPNLYPCLHVLFP